MNLIRQRFLTFATAAAIATISLGTAPTCVEANPPQSTTEFTIEVKLDGGNEFDPYVHWTSSGRFQATGAVKDNGSALMINDTRLMELTGKGGDMEIGFSWDGNGLRFTIIDATGDYNALVGITGSAYYDYEYKPNGDITDYWTLNGSIAP